MSVPSTPRSTTARSSSRRSASISTEADEAIKKEGRRRFAPPPLFATAVAVVAVVALVFAWRRLFLGTDLSDEGFYVAVPYRFALGARPFVDEMNILQTAALFSVPFVKV